MSTNLRQKRYVDPKVQGALVRRFLLHWLLFLLAGFVLLFVWQLLVSGDPLRGFKPVLQDIWKHNMPVFVALVLLLPVFIVDTIKLSHRFAGPVVRLRESLRDWADGEPVEPMQTRRRDFWRDLPDVFNRAIERSEQEKPSYDSDMSDPADEPMEVGA